MKNWIKKVCAILFSFFCFFVVWAAVSKKLDSELILPGIKSVLKKIIWFCSGGGGFWKHFAFSFLRIILSFVISVFFGTVLGLIAGCFNFADDFLRFPVSFLRTVPVISIILIALFWLKSGSVPLFVSVLMTFPVMYTAVRSGFLQNDSSLMQMAQVYNFTKWQKFRYIQLPNLVPFFLNGLVSAFGLTWKVVAAGEVLSVPEYGIGSVLQLNQVHLESASVFAVTLIFAGFSFLSESLMSLLVRLFLKNIQAPVAKEVLHE